MKLFCKKKSLIILIVLVVLMIFINIPFLPKYVEGPGTAPNLKNIVNIHGYPDHNRGKFMFTTVSENKASVVSYVWAKINPHYSIEDEDSVTGGQSQQAYFNLQQMYMKTSINNAIYNAFHYAKKDVKLKYQGIYVLDVDKRSPFYQHVQLGDLIVALNHHKFKSSAQFKKYVQSKRPGDNITVSLYRNNSLINVTQKLYSLPGTQQTGIGIVLTDNNAVSTKLPIKVDPGAVGGPSAGLMFSLQIYSQLIQRNIRKNNDIAGTGTIDEHGNVGEIGGIDKKVIAAKNNGAKYFLSPYIKPTKLVLKYEDYHLTNYQLALKTAKRYAPNLKVIPVTSFEDALHQLKKIK
jgi:Lon-like protease